MTTCYKPGDVVKAVLPFVEGSGSKKRPVAILLDTGDDDVVICKITSRRPRDAYDFRITDLKSAGLPIASTLRVSNVYTLSRAQIEGQLGRLAAPDRKTVRFLLQKILDGWQ